MLTYDDCLALSGLTEEEVEAIAEHEGIPEIVALEMGNYLLHCPSGIKRLKQIIIDDLEAARARGDTGRVLVLRGVLIRFIREHPRHSSNRAQSD